ncbi:aminopeptidase N [Actinocatenispora rupis]|uniref:Aminopeptidase N n=1 Tax=Actinocatenispora rupis TaxID=519421 RepID=A0A8J3ND95_9ACTN|nr:aminopeptidase N [Actinocatenispora rupis]GID14841.1 aminopeptidase [Actinocatenispora rupis]
MTSLTHAEARERARLLTVHSYAVELDLSAARESGGTFGSVSRIRFRCTDPGAATFAELRGRVLSATLNGRELPTALSGNRLPLPDLAADNELVVRAACDWSHTGEGLHRFVDPADGETYVYAMTFLDHAQRVFACFDQPDLKAPLTLTVTVPDDWTVVANERGERVSGAAGRGVWEFATTRPLAPYFMTVCAGPYHSVYRSHRDLRGPESIRGDVRYGLHCRRSLAEHLDADADELFDLSASCLDAYHQLFGVRYPFGDTYDQVFVPEFNMGAMENPGCVTFRDELVFRGAVTEAEREERASIVAHEMAHMWFGDLVTMRWWDDLWLNESFATYLSLRVLPTATRYRSAPATFAAGAKLNGYQADQSSWTHPVAPAEVPDAAGALVNFDAISYPKGASVLRQLAAWLGDEAFVTGLRRHFERHAYGNADLADLVDSLAAASGQDVAGWAELWLRTAGVDRLVPETEVTDGRYTTVHVRQSGVDGAPERPHRIGIGLYRDGRRYHRTELTVHGGRTEVPQLAGLPAADLLLLNDGDLTFATVRLPDGAADRLDTLLPAVTDPLTRALLWGTAWDSVRAGELAPTAFVRLVAGAVASEPQVPVVASMLDKARTRVADRYVDPADRPAALAALAAACEDLLVSAPLAGGRRLAAFRGLVDSCVDTDRLAGWLAGDTLPDGVRVDPELRWRLLTRLVVLGAAGTAEIDAEAARDATAQGAVYALRCRAARPDPDAKAAAWTALLTDTDLPNRHSEALARGFWQPEQADLTAPYVARFFAEIVPAAAPRTTEMGWRLVADSFPRYAVAPDTVAATEALLAGDLTAGVRRGLTEHRDELVVAVRARAAAPVA